MKYIIFFVTCSLVYLYDTEFKSPIGDRSSKLLSAPVHDLHTLDLFNYFFIYHIRLNPQIK